MFLNKKSYPKCKQMVAYADLTGKGKGILKKHCLNAVIKEEKLTYARGFNKIYHAENSFDGVLIGP